MSMPDCRICAIEQDFKRILDDSEGDTGNALAVCYIAGYSEAALIPETMAKSFCPRHAGKVLRYSGQLAKMVLATAAAKGMLDNVPQLPPPTDKGLN